MAPSNAGLTLVNYRGRRSAYQKQSQTDAFFSTLHLPIFALNLPVFVPLLKLPPEIRTIIYEYALRLDDKCVITATVGIPGPALLRTCKAIRHEAIGVFYTNNEFCQRLCPKAATLVFRKMVSLSQDYGLGFSLTLVVKCGPPSWRNLVAWLQWRHESVDAGYIVPATESLLTYSQREAVMIYGLFQVVDTARDQPWERVAKILNSLRQGLIQFDERWATDEIEEVT